MHQRFDLIWLIVQQFGVIIGASPDLIETNIFQRDASLPIEQRR